MVQNTGMPAQSFSRYRQLWLAEAIRHLEHGGWLDDQSILPALARANAGGGEALILARARLLAGVHSDDPKRSISHPVVAGLAAEIRRVEAAAGLATFVIALLAVVGGVSTAAAVLGGSSVNVVLAVAALLGLHLVTLVLWGFGLLLSFSSHSFTATNTDALSDGLWGRLSRRLLAGEHRLVLLRAASTLPGRSRLVFWVYALLSHLWWSVFFLAAAVVLTWLFALHEYSFRWETTILPAGFFVHFVEALGWLPQQLGLRVPTPAAVGALIDDAATRQAWANWLLTSVFAYGFLPRALLALISRWRCRQLRQGLRLDLEQPYYVGLRQRLDVLLQPAATIVDPAPAQAESPHLWRQAADGQHVGGAACKILFGFELADDVLWPPALSPAITVAGNLTTGDERDLLLRSLAGCQPQRLVAACDARAGLDRGTLYFFRDAARHADVFAVLLFNQKLARAGRAANWREALLALGVAEAHIFADLVAASQWLEGCDD